MEGREGDKLGNVTTGIQFRILTFANGASEVISGRPKLAGPAAVMGLAHLITSASTNGTGMIQQILLKLPSIKFYETRLEALELLHADKCDRRMDRHGETESLILASLCCESN